MQEVIAQKVEVWVVRQHPEHYCTGYAKGSAKACHDAADKYHEGTAGAYSQLPFDTYTLATIIPHSGSFPRGPRHVHPHTTVWLTLSPCMPPTSSTSTHGIGGVVHHDEPEH